ncbi:chaplin [Streptomyces sp. NPDC020719]|uniref:chaplin n=1 Tax=Streptomyces sp. NPDC020719 TaxID=3154896 RepID=UPI0033C91965
MKRIAKSMAMAGTSAAVVVLGAGVAAAGGHGGAHADGVATHSPGVLSGNVIQVPIHVPINVCGNTVNLIGVLNPAFGNRCTND